MTTEEHDEVAASEQSEINSEDTQQQQEEQKMVPLAALQAERKKRQELEIRNKIYEEMQQSKAKEDPEEDPEALMTKGTFNEEKALTKREILEQVYADMNPKEVQKVNTYLKPILDKKPWLAASLDSAQNRLARASEIVDDYMHLLDDKPRQNTSAQDAQRILDNAKKPRSPADVGKSAQPSGTAYLKSIQGKKEFREYRQKVLNGEI